MAQDVSSNDKDDKLTQFVQTIDCDAEVATTYLEACGWNLETAIDRYYSTEGDVTKLHPSQPAPSAQSLQSGMQQLLTSQASDGNIDNFLQMFGDQNRQYIANSNNSMENLDNLDTSYRSPDMAYQEQLLPNQQFIGTQIYQQQKDSLKNFGKQWQMGKKTSKADYLADLFSEPDYRFQGPLDSAKKAAADKNSWLLVNIQTTEAFVSHCLNRDVWKDKEFSKTVQAAFILYQCESTTTNGKHFVNLYNVTKVPCIYIIDPNTGRKEKEFNVPESPENLGQTKQEIIDFLNDYPNPKQKPKVAPVLQPISALEHAESVNDEEMLRALQMSLDENKGNEIVQQDKNIETNNQNKNDIETNDINNSAQNTNDVVVDNSPNYTLEPEPEEKDPNATAIRVRLPNGTTIQRRFKKHSKIEELYKWISITENQKKITLVQPIPRLMLDDKKDQTLQQAGIIKAMLTCSYD